MAVLGSIQIPTITAGDFNSEQKIQQILETVMQLDKQLRYVMYNLDTDNMTDEMTQTVTDMKAAAREIETKVSDGEFMSYVKQTARELELRVQKDEVVACINMSPEEIKIIAQKISLEGLVTVNGFFKIHLDGTMEATGGKIAGWTIGQGELYTGYNTAEVSPGLYLGTRNIEKAVAIAGSGERADWRMKIGAAFGVTAAGDVFGESGNFRGNVSAGNIQHNVQGGYDYGTLNGAGISIYSIGGSRIVSSTIGNREMEDMYEQMKAMVLELQNRLGEFTQTGTLRAGTAFLNVAYIGDGSNAPARVQWRTMTIDGVTRYYLGR